jgi:hypothetical protein
MKKQFNFKSYLKNNPLLSENTGQVDYESAAENLSFANADEQEKFDDLVATKNVEELAYFIDQYAENLDSLLPAGGTVEGLADYFVNGPSGLSEEGSMYSQLAGNVSDETLGELINAIRKATKEGITRSAIMNLVDQLGPKPMPSMPSPFER